MMRIGQQIPALMAKAYQQDRIVDINLQNYKGKWAVLFFYPADFTFVCPTELKEMAALYPEFKNRNAEVLSVSVDTVYVHKAWHDTSDAVKGSTFPMVADPTKTWCQTFGTLNEKEGLSYRATIIVDPNGIVKVIQLQDNSIGRSGKEILRQLTAAQFTYEHGDQVCPASWEEGEPTLTAGLNLVGKI